MNSPIGIFDSGYGGLTILSEIRKTLPQYDYIYLGDNARTPYGTRSFEVVYQYTLQAVKHLFSEGCELVILACNTASAKALRQIQRHDLPEIAPDKRVLGVIRPSTELVGSLSKSGHVGILGTQGTVRSRSYVIEVEKFFPNVKVWQESCPLWVPLVENGQHDSEGGHYFIKHHIDNLLGQQPEIDVIVLGCTHYPLLKSIIEQYVPDHVQVLAQGEIVAKSLADYLVRHPEMETRISQGGTINYLTTENPENFNTRAGIFLSGVPINAQQVILK